MPSGTRGHVLRHVDQPEREHVDDRGHRPVDGALAHAFERISHAHRHRRSRRSARPSANRVRHRSAAGGPSGRRQCAPASWSGARRRLTNLRRGRRDPHPRIPSGSFAGDNIFGHRRAITWELRPTRAKSPASALLRPAGGEVERQVGCRHRRARSAARPSSAAAPTTSGPRIVAVSSPPDSFARNSTKCWRTCSVGRVGRRGGRSDAQLARVGHTGTKRERRRRAPQTSRLCSLSSPPSRPPAASGPRSLPHFLSGSAGGPRPGC